jgi:hypothetical protein
MKRHPKQVYFCPASIPSLYLPNVDAVSKKRAFRLISPEALFSHPKSMCPQWNLRVRLLLITLSVVLLFSHTATFTGSGKMEEEKEDTSSSL